jgi:translation initiation factor 1
MGRFSDEPPRIVFSSDRGSVCPECGADAHTGACTAKEVLAPTGKPALVRMERAGRKGKTVTVIKGLELSEAEKVKLLKILKQKCGSGGTLLDGQLEIQGDHCDLILKLLSEGGFRAKRG